MGSEIISTSVGLFTRLRRTPYQSLACIFMIFTTLLVAGIFLCLALMSSSIIGYFETKPQLTIFFKDEKDKSSIDALSEKLKNTQKVSSVEFISKEQALALYREQNKNDPLLLEMVTADILPSSLEVSATSPKYLADLDEVVKAEDGIDEVVFQKDIVDRLVAWTSLIRKIGIGFIIVLTITSFFILLTSISMKIAMKKDEVEILKLSGATSWYIRRPFIAEGVVYGLIGAALAGLIITLVILYGRPYVTSFLNGIPTLTLFEISKVNVTIWPPSLAFLGFVWAVLILAGMLIGFMGSYGAVARYERRQN